MDAVLELMGAFVIWAFQGFKGKFVEHLNYNTKGGVVGLVVIILLLFFVILLYRLL
jgi:hypothetical protein